MSHYCTEKLYCLDDLEGWDRSGVSLAVIGDSIGYSMSPLIHNGALEEMAKRDSRFEDWRYYKFHVEASQLWEGLDMFHKKGFVGLNVTVPHKVSVMEHCVSIDEVAKRVGSVNTLVMDHGGYRGMNTDGYGLTAALKYHFGISLEGRDVILLGAGGAAKAAGFVALVSDCKKLWVGNRSQERLEGLLKNLGVMGAGKIEGFRLGMMPENLPREAVIINATAIGLGVDIGVGEVLDFEYFDKGGTYFYDMVYGNGVTPLMNLSNRVGIAGASGQRMLVEQAALSLEAWSQEKVPVEVMWEVLTSRPNL